jgi:hypothetical protein
MLLRAVNVGEPVLLDSEEGALWFFGMTAWCRRRIQSEFVVGISGRGKGGGREHGRVGAWQCSSEAEKKGL